MAKNPPAQNRMENSSLKAAFKKAQGPVFRLNDAVAEAYDMFPDIEDHIFFVDVHNHNVVHPNPVIRAQIIGLLNTNEDIRGMLNDEIFFKDITKTSACMNVTMNGIKFSFLLLYLEKDMTSLLGKDHNLSQSRFFLLDHELAHAMIPQACVAEKVSSESVADAFMSLRHYQRYGIDSKTVEKAMKRRAAYGFFNNDSDHFTAPVLEKIIAHKDTLDIEVLSPKATARVAVRMAKRYQISEKDLKRLSCKFKKVSSSLQTLKGDAPLRNFAKMAFAAKLPVTKKWTQTALGAFLDKSIDFKPNTKRSIPLKGAYWDNLRQKLKTA